MHFKIILSLTSYPKRINIISKVIKSLFQQKVKADKIILWLSLDEFPEKENNLPEVLLSLCGKNGFQIRWVTGNLKSHKKYFYALQEFSDDIVITVDDDMIYSSEMVAELLESHCKHPNTIVARCVRIILKQRECMADYMFWNYDCENYRGQKRMDLCAIGCHGILYPPHIATKRWFDISTIINLCPEQDDLWLKYNEILDEIPTVYDGHKGFDKIETAAQESALCNRNMLGNQNNICIAQLHNWSKIQNKNRMEKWIHDVNDITSYYLSIWKNLANDLRRILDINIKKKIYICGAGKYARALIALFKYCKKNNMISALLVSDYIGNPKTLEGIPVILLNDIKGTVNTLILCGVSEKNRQFFKNYFNEPNCWIDLDISNIYLSFQILYFKRQLF